MLAGLNVPAISRAYGVKVIDYEREGEWLLVSSGAGIMSAVMDAEPSFRWCADIDESKGGKLVDWMLWMERLCQRIAVVGWFSITNPEPLRLAVSSLSTKPLCYTQGVDLGGDQCDSLDEFLSRLKQARNCSAMNLP